MQILETVTSTLCGRKQMFAQNSDLQKKLKQGRGVNRWMIYKQLCVAKSQFGLNDRCLAVLSSLLSFLPEDEISSKNGIVVFPSNRQLSLRAHGMPESTLRRHLVSLVEAGIIARKDSPTRKRYAHKDREGGVELAFGFSLAPMLDRASEIAEVAEKLLADQKALKRLRDEVSVARREIASVFADETYAADASSGHLKDLFVRFRAIVDAIPRRASVEELSVIKARLEAIRAELHKLLKNMDNASELSGSVAQIERQHNESLPESLFESKNIKTFDLKEPCPEKPVISEQNDHHPVDASFAAVPLDMVLRTCPDIRDYSSNGIASWRDLVDASRTVSVFLGITQSAYREAIAIMGAENTSAVIAWLLQRAGEISSAGGYLRSLTQKARAGTFSIALMLMSGLKAQSPSVQGLV